MRFRVYAETETPFAVSVRRATGNDLETQRLLSGTVIRGAIAGAYLEEHQEADEGFKALFLQKLVRFGDLRIGDSRPWPLSTRQCAAKPNDHAKVDNLLRAGAGLALPVECEDRDEDPRDRAKLELPKGYYLYKQPDESHEFQYGEEEVRLRRLAHAEIDPVFLKARPGQFHSSQLIDSGQSFIGSFFARQEGGEQLRKLIGEGRTLYVGRGRSRGQGRIKVSMFPDPGRDAAQIRRKIERMNAVARELRAEGNAVVFSCTLDSATLLYDRWLRSRCSLDAGDLDAELEESGYRVRAQFQRPTAISGWHAKGGLPKTEVAAIAGGSCFLFRREGCTNAGAEYDKLAQIFVRLEERGVGERLDEGFGEVTFCRTLHCEFGR